MFGEPDLLMLDAATLVVLRNKAGFRRLRGFLCCRNVALAPSPGSAVKEGQGLLSSRVNMEHTILPLWWLEQWMANFTTALQHTRQVFPKALLVCHTSVPPAHDVNGLPPSLEQGWARLMWIAQMNAAGRTVCERLNVPTVDWEHIAAGFTSYQAKIDLTHPSDWLNLEALNVELNLLDEYRQAEAAVAAATAAQPSVAVAHEQVAGQGPHEPVPAGEVLAAAGQATQGAQQQLLQQLQQP